MTRRQFIAACLMLLVAVCLLDLERLREWWKSVGGREIRAFEGVMRAEIDDAYDRIGADIARHLWGAQQPHTTFMNPQDHSDLCQELLARGAI